MTQEQMNRILDIGIALTSEQDIHALLERILSEAMVFTNCDAGTLYLKEGNYLKFAILRNNTLHTYQGGHGEPIDIPPVPLDREHVSSLALLENRTILIADVYEDSLDYCLQGPRGYDSVTGYHTQSVLVVPMKDPRGNQVGVLQLLNAMTADGSVCEFSADSVMAVESIASQAAVALSNARQLKENQDMFQSFVETMVAAVGTLTPYNENHTRNMVTYGKKFLKYLRETSRAIPASNEKQLLMAIWLHDLGKLVTPISIMNKNTRLWPQQKTDILHRMESFRLRAELMEMKGRLPKEEARKVFDRTQEIRDFLAAADTNVLNEREELLKKYSEWSFPQEDGTAVPYLQEAEIHQLSVKYRTLTDEEFEIMHNHVVQTDKLLSSMHFPSDMPNVRQWASAHHELLNGKGYPQHLHGEQIPTEVRILTILDIFEALTATDREYKKPKTPEDAITHLHKIAGFGEVDDALVTLFEESRCWE